MVIFSRNTLIKIIVENACTISAKYTDEFFLSHVHVYSCEQQKKFELQADHFTKDFLKIYYNWQN